MEPLSIPRGSIYFRQKICQTRKQIIGKSQEVVDVEFRSPLGRDPITYPTARAVESSLNDSGIFPTELDRC